MIDKTKEYSLNELLNIYSLYNIDFKYYGNNNNGELELYLKTDADKVSVFISNLKISKKEYLKLTEKEARKIKFIYDREVNELELDVVAVVLRTSDINIPAGRYTLSTLDKLTKEQDLEEREETELSDGIAYIVVDNNKIGYLIYTPNPYSFKLDEEYKIYVYQNIREDENTLYGFKSIEEKELFYIMSRGFNLKEAMKLIVKAKFNKIIENIINERLKEEILEEIDKRLD